MDEREYDAYLDLVEFGIHRGMFDDPETLDSTFESEEEWLDSIGFEENEPAYDYEG